MKKLKSFLICLLIFSPGDDTFGQEEQESIRIMFWNVENFFDPFDDSITLDDEFTSGGNYGWTWGRFNQKLNNIYKVIMSTGWEPPDIIGLCEVENKWVLERLTRMTPLSKFEYHIIHHDSPDSRGIDVAMLYLPDSYRPLKTAFIPATGLKTNDDPTRDILFVKGIMKSRDTVNIFVNHWPSRYPGQVETMHKRRAAAIVLKRKTDSLFTSEPGCKIIIMGDFNDEPWDESISEILCVGVVRNEKEPDSGGRKETRSEEPIAALPRDSISDVVIIRNDLYNLIPSLKRSITGTLKFEGRWYLFDQFMISGDLLARIISYEIEIVDHNFLLIPDEDYTGMKPFRTYNGYIYTGGYSDHLPVILNLSFNK